MNKQQRDKRGHEGTWTNFKQNTTVLRRCSRFFLLTFRWYGVIYFHVQPTDAECSWRSKLPLIKRLISRTPDSVTLTLGSVMKTDGGLDLSRTSRLLIFLMRLLMSGLYLRRIYAQKGGKMEEGQTFILFLYKLCHYLWGNMIFYFWILMGCKSPTALKVAAQS